MGRSRFTSDIYGKVKITVASVNATNLKGLVKLQAPKVHASSYIQIGTSQYIFATDESNQASVVAAATVLVGATIKGSISLDKTNGACWVHTSNTAASRVIYAP